MATTLTTSAGGDLRSSSDRILGAGPAAAEPGRSVKMKRTLTRANFLRTVTNVVASIPVLLVSLVRPRIAKSLREKILLGVSAVNDCRYCQWGHSHWAKAHGVPLEEINEILGGATGALCAKDPAEGAAILFAQHYAENQGRCEPEAVEYLRRFYTHGQVAEILGYARAITLGSLTGNTMDAILARLRRSVHRDRHGAAVAPRAPPAPTDSPPSDAHAARDEAGLLNPRL